MNPEEMGEHEYHTEQYQRELRGVDDMTLVMRGLALLLLDLRSTIYDFPPDDAAVIRELQERGRQRRRRRPTGERSRE